MPSTITSFPSGLLPGNTKGFISVSKKWAEQHPDSVIRAGDNYYRPAITAGDDSYLSTGDKARMLLEKIRAGELEFKGAEGWKEKEKKPKVEGPTPTQEEIYQAGSQTITEAQAKGIEKSTIKLADGSLIPKSGWDNLPKAYQKIGLKEGYKPMVEAIEAGGIIKEGRLVAQPIRIPGMEPVGIIREIRPIKAEPLSKQHEIYTWQYKGKRITKQDRQQLIDEYENKRNRLIRQGKMFTDEWFKLGAHPKDEIVRTPEASAKVLKSAGIFAAEMIVPGLYVGRHWNELSAGEKAVWTTIDALVFIPLITAAARGARTVGVAGKGTRAIAAAKEVGRETVAIARAPVDMIIHPISTAKSTVRQLRNVIENIAHPGKLPEAIITTSSGTVRLRVSETTSAKEAKAIRDKIVQLAARGETPIVEIGKTKIELTRSPLMKELKGGLTHATPMGAEFEGALRVTSKPGIRASEQGLFLSPEPLPKFAELSAFGKTGKKPIIIITSRETAAKAITTGKIYKSPFGNVAEMEAKFRVGEVIPGAQQKLFTRVGSSAQRVELWLEKPLTIRQIAKLKAKGLVEWIKAPFKEPIKISGRVAGLTTSQTDDLARILRKAGNARQAENLLRAERITQYSRRVAPALSRAVRAAKVDRISGLKAESRIDRVSRAERPTRATKTDRISRAARRGEVERPSRIEERLPGRRERGARAERPTRLTAETRTERATGEERPPRTERPSRTERPLRTGRPPRTPPKTPRPPRTEKLRLPAPPGDEERRRAFEGAIAWKQGFGWWAIKEPYASNADVAFFFGDPPPGAKKIKGGLESALRSIQTITGKAPKNLTIDMGIMDVKINEPGASPGRQGAIRFTRDPTMKTKSRITIGSARGTGIKKEGPYYRIPGAGLSRNKPRGKLLS